MTRSELVTKITDKFTQLAVRDIEEATRFIFEKMVAALEDNMRIEIRGFGSFELRYHKPREGRNPKTGEKVELEEKYVLHFKPGKELRERVNQAAPAI